MSSQSKRVYKYILFISFKRLTLLFFADKLDELLKEKKKTKIPARLYARVKFSHLLKVIVLFFMKCVRVDLCLQECECRVCVQGTWLEKVTLNKKKQMVLIHRQNDSPSFSKAGSVFGFLTQHSSKYTFKKIK